MNSLTFAAMLLVTFVTTFYLGYLFGRDVEQESQDYARRIRNDYERK